MYARTVSGLAWTGQERPDFELRGSCSVFSWGINWRPRQLPANWEHLNWAELELEYEQHSARWEDITEVRQWHVSEQPSAPIPSAPVPILVGGSTTYCCKVVLADGRIALFERTYRHGVPVGWRTPKPKPGTTKRVNIKQLGRLIEMGVARTQLP
jgi:hypothetical protein